MSAISRIKRMGKILFSTPEERLSPWGSSIAEIGSLLCACVAASTHTTLGYIAVFCWGGPYFYYFCKAWYLSGKKDLPKHLESPED